MSEFRSLTHELHAFWASRNLGHDRADHEISDAEYPEFSPRIQNLLRRSGFFCRRQIAACPDWLLKTVPNLGRKGLSEIRAAIPFHVDVWRMPCPGAKIDRRRYEEAMVEIKRKAG